MDGGPSYAERYVTNGPIYRTYSDRLLICGDAAGQVFAGIGEGIYFSLKAGQIAGQTATKAIESETRFYFFAALATVLRSSAEPELLTECVTRISTGDAGLPSLNRLGTIKTPLASFRCDFNQSMFESDMKLWKVMRALSTSCCSSESAAGGVIKGEPTRSAPINTLQIMLITL